MNFISLIFLRDSIVGKHQVFTHLSLFLVENESGILGFSQPEFSLSFLNLFSLFFLLFFHSIFEENEHLNLDFKKNFSMTQQNIGVNVILYSIESIKSLKFNIEK